MKQVVSTENLVKCNLVATFNADPFAVEYDEQLTEVMEALGNTATRYDADDEEFQELAAKLDGNEETYEYIYANNDVIVGILR